MLGRGARPVPTLSQAYAGRDPPQFERFDSLSASSPPPRATGMPGQDSTAALPKAGSSRKATGEFPQSQPQPRPRRPLIIATILILTVHGALLVSTLTDWRVTLDSGYHISLARAYAEHGLVPWDHIN